MPEYLTLALVAPMAAFGDIAVGEHRPTSVRPARSAVFGLIAAALGLERSDEPAHRSLTDDYGLALLGGTGKAVLTDYHSVQTAPRRRGPPPATRADALAADTPYTVLTRRDYRMDAWFLAAVWPYRPSRWTLAELANALTHPRFTPYLGRKSCPLGLPMAPRIGSADSPIDALLQRHKDGPERDLTTPKGERKDRSPLTLALAPEDIDGAHQHFHVRTEVRRDQLRSRARWQFDQRQEAVVVIPAPGEQP